MGHQKPGFLENLWVRAKYFRKKNPVSLVGCVISNPVASELYGRGGFIGFVNTDQRYRRTRPYKNYDDTIPNQTEMI
jgi:hypothetical protein